MKNKKNQIKFKNGLLPTIIYYYKKEWVLSLTMLILCLTIVSCAVMLPLLTLQMTLSIMEDVMPNVDGQKWDPNAAAPPVLGFWGIHWSALIFIALAIIITYCFLSFFYDYFAYKMGRRIEISLRNRCLETLVRQDISYYSDKKIGEILTKIISDTQIVGDQAVQVPLQFGISFFEIIGSATIMFILSWNLAFVPITAFFTIIAIMSIFFAITKRKTIKVREVITDINGNVTDRVATVRLIKSSGTENYETDRFINVHKEYYKKAITVGKIQALMLTTMWGGIFALQFSTIIGAMLIFGNDQEKAADFFQTTFTAFTLAQGMMIGPLFQIMNALFGLGQATVSASRVNQTINSPSIMNPHYFDGQVIEKITGDIIFKDIEFAYPEKPEQLVLPKFDFTFKQGKSYAFVGETGSGKSTIAKLLLRFYDPSKGQIIINQKHNLKDLNLASYLKHIGYVEQDPQILFGDVYENVRYGKFEATDEEVIEACKKAELHELVTTWPAGYDTILGERGFMLSGGQKQRLVIARMFLKNPEVLILDEATSALDNIVEKEIQVKLDTLMKGRTTVSIAHRLSTIKNADEILVLGANGKGIVQQGTFNQLKDTPGHFKKLYEAGLIDQN